MRRIRAVIQKEWEEVFKNRLVLSSVLFLPLFLTAIALVILYMTGAQGATGDIATGDMPPAFAGQCSGLTGGECAQYWLVSQFMILFMLMPLIIPATIAAYSIVGEKTTRTLEPILATPISTLELLAGKGLAAVLPAVLVTWGAFLVFALGARLMSTTPGVLGRLTDPFWLLAVLVVGPLLAISAVSAAVMVSSRVNDPRVAEQVSVLVILPLLALFFSNLTGLIVFNAQLVLLLIVILSILDALLVTLAIRLFQRETILTRWK